MNTTTVPALINNRDYRNLFLAQLTSLAGTGISSIALALLAYNLAGDEAGKVLGTALALKILAYVFLAPVFSNIAQQLPPRLWLSFLDFARAGLLLFLPFVTEIWQVYLLIFLINACSAGFTPVYQALLPRVLPDKDQYTRALSNSRLAYDLEQLLSPSLAAILLTVMSSTSLFVADAFTFIISAALILCCSPAVVSKSPGNGQSRFHRGLTTGVSTYLKTPELRILLAGYLAVASASAMAIVNTVVYVQEQLGGGNEETALAMAVMGSGSMAVALLLPNWLKTHTIQPLLFTGAGLITATLLLATTLPDWIAFAALWFTLGAGLAMIQTPSGLLITRAANDENRNALFAAQFSLSHACWFITYLLAGWCSATVGLETTFLIMSLIALTGLLLMLYLSKGKRSLSF
ncbi:MFS transporter [Parendozoicomonas haliclonae]|uniref:Major Facilitator Superfamily protein n=1 Tax=Parendozoicomonas haliclonae TaxID=1960125 RepID=A0A1X7AI16_9GAMM|nr:MFS transporter [Parendozoicomonas haliclonae]SMA42769.1 Major Facilitator Superfamily protein [Parendozoicomonas haliclonae]